jgi:hypothetical protein
VRFKNEVEASFMLLEKYREDAVAVEQSLQHRLNGWCDSRIPLEIIRRWRCAFEGDEVDLDAITDAVRDAEKVQSDYEIAFFTYCNSMRRICHELWQAFLNRRLQVGEPGLKKDESQETE